VKFQGFPETFVAEVSDIENEAKAGDLSEEFAAARRKGSAGAGPKGVAAFAVVGRADGAQPGGVEAVEMLEGNKRVRALEAEDIADGEVVLGGRRR